MLIVFLYSYSRIQCASLLMSFIDTPPPPQESRETVKKMTVITICWLWLCYLSTSFDWSIIRIFIFYGTTDISGIM